MTNSLPDDAQYRFGVLHFAYLPHWTRRVTCLPSPRTRLYPCSNYYGDSVTIGLAPRRSSRFRCYSTSERDVGALLIPLNALIWHRSSCKGCDGTRFIPSHRMSPVVRRFFRWVDTCTERRLGFRQSSFHHIARVTHAVALQRLQALAHPACYCPVNLSASNCFCSIVTTPLSK